MNRRKSMTQIDLPPILGNSPEGKGYMGHATFRVDGRRLLRSFPIYRDGDPNCCPKGGTRTVAYALVRGEAGWILKGSAFEVTWNHVEIADEDRSRTDGWEIDAVQNATRAAAAGAAPSGKYPAASLLGIPLFHVMGLNGGFLSSWRAQRRVVCMTKWDAAQAAELIERERVTSFSAPPAMTGDLVREGQRTARDLSSLVTVGGGGAARAPEQVRQIDSTFRRAAPSIGWGMTETNAAGTIISGAEYLAHPSAAGFRLSVVDLRIVDADDRPLPDGERGELQVRGAPMFLEYWNRPDAMDSSFTADGWFRTGDVAHLDGDLLHIVDRIKDLIIRGGENIGCGHVEAALLAHPSVIEAAVYAVPDTRLGEEVGATVFGTSDLDLDELWEFLSQRLARHEVPRYIFTSDAPLARTATGKVLKRQLRDEGVERVRAEQG